MKRFFSALKGAAICALVASTPAQAVEYGTLVQERSKVAFAYTQMGVSMEGSFKKFEASLAFDPAKPETGRAALAVDLASIDTGLDEANGEAVGKAWFDVQRHPRATFEASKVEAMGSAKYAVTGTFTLKGHAKEITVPVTCTQDGHHGVFEGRFTLNRNDYAIGEGAWSAVDVVANPVEVSFSLVFQGR